MLAMTNPNSGSANPQAGGQNAAQTVTNPQAGGSPTSTPAQHSGAPAGGTGSNPLAGGSGNDQANNPPNDDEGATVSAAQHRETLREAKVNREKWQAAEKRLQALEDAKLSEQELVKKRLQEAEAQVTETTRANHGLRLQIAIEEQVRSLDLVSTRAVKSLLLQEYADQLDDDLANVNSVINQAIADNPWLKKQEPSPQSPNSGRSVSPPRTPAGQYTQQRPPQPQTPLPYNQFPTFSQLTEADWDTESRKQRGQ
jgi:paraquat-inducible protein B